MDSTVTPPRVKKVLNLSVDIVDGQGLFQGEKVEHHLVPYLRPLAGFRGTTFSKSHDLTKQWTTFTMADCEPPGKIQGH